MTRARLTRNRPTNPQPGSTRKSGGRDQVSPTVHRTGKFDCQELQRRTAPTALKRGLAEAKSKGGREKAIIFTESTRTQEYVRSILESIAHYKSKVVLFNGSNNDTKSKEIYQNWLKKHAGTDHISGSKTADMRAALVEYFHDEAIIMIATEAAAEGINLQFCSLVINYDLPWNPQRIEQRIGRCHRYGQKHDVVVVNFLNKKNAADQRVYQLLDEKFKLFSGVFGASDEVLGSIGSGIDFESASPTSTRSVGLRNKSSSISTNYRARWSYR